MLSATLAKRKLLKLHAQMTYKQKEKQYYNFFTKSEGKQQVCYLNTSATSFYNNAYKKIIEQRCDVFRLILHS